MKHLRLSLLAVLTMMGTLLHAQTNILRVDTVKAPSGKVLGLNVVMENTSDVAGVQFDISVPYELVTDDEGVVVTEAARARIPNHTVLCRKKDTQWKWYYPDGEGTSARSLTYHRYRVIVYSDRNELVVDNKGTLLTLQLTTDVALPNNALLPVYVENVTMTDLQKQNVATGSKDGAIVIEQIPRPDLEPSGVTFSPDAVKPGEKVVVEWQVKNVGLKATEDGWTEQISLVNLAGTTSKTIATAYYGEALAQDGVVSRQAEIELPQNLGLDGLCKVKIEVVPTDKTGEHPTMRDNNTAVSLTNINIEKKIVLELSKTRFTEGSQQRVQAKLSRSGSWTLAQTFQIALTPEDSRVDIQHSVTIPAGQSGVVFYFHVNDNDVVDADSLVSITIRHADYTPITQQIVIEDNEYPALTVEASKTDLNEGDQFNLTITTPRVSTEPITVMVQSEDNSRFLYKSTAVIPANEKSVTVPVTCVDDELPNLEQSNKFTVSAKNLSPAEVIVILHDNDMPVLTLELTPNVVNEGDGPTAVAAVLTRTGKTNNAITVKISDDSNGGLYYGNKSITMDKGVESVFFNLGPIDNTLQEGDRTYTVTAAIYVKSCSCAVSGENAGNVKAQLTVLDNDGAALSISSQAATVKEGGETTLVVSRNTLTDVSQPLAVTLSSNYDAELEYSSSVTIPVGETSAEVAVKSKKNDVSGDSKTVVFTVSAAGYASGTCMLLVTDQTLPDARANGLKLSASESMIGTQVTASVSVTNDGAYPLAANTPVMFYLKGKADAIGTSHTEQEIPVGGTAVIERVITLPESVGEHTYYVVVNAQRSVTELVYTNNTSNEVTVKATSPFTVKIGTDKQVYKQGDMVRISGQLTGQKTTNETIDVYLMNEGAREVKQVKTDAEGRFSMDWQLYERQTGHFAIGACYKDDPTTEELAAFDVYGLKRTDTGYITCDVTCGEPYTGVIRLANAGKLALSGVKAQAVSAPEGCEAQLQVPEDIGAGETVNLVYTLNGKTASPGNDWEQLKVQVTSSEGAFLEVTLHYYARMAQGNLVVEKQNLITTMNKDTGRDYNFFVTNNGKGNTGRISLSLPQWIKPLTGATLPGLNQNDTATVVLRMMPTDDMQLNVPVTGTLGINCENGNGTYINFNITPVSDKTGTLVIDVTDEYTYYTDEKPHVSGAEVVLKNPVTGALVAQGLSDENGLYSIELPEGYYQVNVTADKHDSYKNNILVDPGSTTTKVVCLSYQAISVSWGVEETEVEDEYNIVTTVKFETNVPAPVVEVVEPNTLDIGQLGAGESLVYYAILTNKGLINANNTSYTIPEMAGDCMLEPLVESKGLTLLPQQSYTIPVKVTKMSRESTTHSINDTQSDTQWLWDYDPNVTPPVVEVTEPDAVDVADLGPGEGTTYEVTLTNRGSVPVRDVSYTVPIVSGNHKWRTLDENKGIDLAPEESITIRVEITPVEPGEAESLRNSEAGRSKSSSKNGRCVLSSVTDYNWECGPDNKWGWYPHTIKLVPPVDCTSAGDRGLWTIYGQGLGSPGGGGGSSYSSSENYNGVSFSAECNPCLKNLTNMVLDAGDCAAIKFVPLAGCAWGLGRSVQGFLNNYYEGTAKDWTLWGIGTFSSVMGCIPGASTVWGVIGCALAIYDISTGCGDKPASARLKVMRASSTPSWVDTFADKVKVGNDYFQAYQDYGIEFYGDSLWGNLTTVDEAIKLNDAVEQAIQNGNVDADALRAYKPNDITNEQFNHFIERIQNTLAYDRDNPDPSVTNVIRPEVLLEALKIMQKCHETATEEYGYENVGGIYDNDFQQFVDKLREESSSTCATISLQIDQTMTMTRQAFRGTLTVTNGNKDLPITDAKLKLNVTNRQTNQTATAKEFEMHTESLKMFKGDLDMESGWYLGPDSTGTATILFIPSKYAAPDEPVEYSFGGTLSYIDPNSGLEVTRDLYPVTLTVKPSPELDLTYFMQRDLYGDDALTEAVEPVVPGEFAVLINNKGNGDATNVRMVTKQPQIIENEKGLYIDFEFVSSQLNGQEKVMAMGETIPTEFGTIPAHSQAYAQWWLQSSLLGHFVDYDIQATHVTSYGNENLSLLDQVTIHELIHGFTPPADTDNESVGRAFLVNDITDMEDLPDHLYFTDGTQQEVSVTAETLIEKQSNTEYTLTILPTAEGWNYGSLLDPTVGRRKLLSIVRLNDNTELPVDNIWQTDRTLVDARDWRYENRLHFIADFPASALLEGLKYKLIFEERSDIALEVKSITGMELGDDPVRTAYVDEVTVEFNKAIQAETFTQEDVTLTVQGQKQDLSTVGFASDDNTVWKLDFTALNRTLPNGYYVLTVQTSGIKDYEGYNGFTGKKADWVLFLGGLVQVITTEYPLHSGNIMCEKISGTSESASARIQAPADGSVTSVRYGDRYRFTATANDGYEFLNWTLDGAVVSTNPVYETTVTSDQNLVANFAKKQCRIDVASAGNGSVSGTGLYDYGTQVNIVATADEDFVLKGWTVNGEAVATAGDTLTVTADKPMTITAEFVRDIFTQTLTLVRGWNWVSTYLDEAQQLGNFTKYASLVLSQKDELVLDPESGLAGSITSILPGMAYKIDAVNNFSTTMRGRLYGNVISLQQGWNWMAYPYFENRDLTSVLTNAEEGDYIVAQDGFSQYGNGVWEGTLYELVPGQGYLYKSVSAKQLAFDFTKTSSGAAVASLLSVDAHQYPHTMNITARILRDGTELPGEQYTVYAFAGDELRGISQFVGSHHYLTAYGDNPVGLAFVVEQNETGETFGVADTLQFVSDVVGSRSQPLTLNVITTSVISHLADGAPLTVYTPDGVLVCRDATKDQLRRLPKGVYIVNKRKCLVH